MKKRILVNAKEVGSRPPCLGLDIYGQSFLMDMGSNGFLWKVVVKDTRWDSKGGNVGCHGTADVTGDVIDLDIQTRGVREKR